MFFLLFFFLIPKSTLQASHNSSQSQTACGKWENPPNTKSIRQHLLSISKPEIRWFFHWNSKHSQWNLSCGFEAGERLLSLIIINKALLLRKKYHGWGIGLEILSIFQTFFMLLGSSPNLSANPLVPLCRMDIIIVFFCLLSTQWGNMSQYMFVKHFAQETTKKHTLSIAHSHQHWFPPLSIPHFQLFDGILPVAR